MLEDLTAKTNELSIIGRVLNLVLPQAYMATSVKDLQIDLPQEIERRNKENNPVKTTGEFGHKYCFIITQGAYNLEPQTGVNFDGVVPFTIERATLTDISNNMIIYYTSDGLSPRIRSTCYEKIDGDSTRIYSPVFWYDVEKNRLFLRKFKDDMPRPRSPDSARKSIGPLETVLSHI